MRVPSCGRSCLGALGVVSRSAMSLPLVLTVAVVAVIVGSTANVEETSSHNYATAVIAKYSPNGYLNLEEFETFFNRFMTENTPGDENAGYGRWCRDMARSNNTMCIECSSSQDLFEHYAEDGRLNSTALLEALPALLMAVEEEYCKMRKSNNTGGDFEDIHMPRKPTTAEVWGYGLGVVFMVIGLSNLGGCMTPCMKSPSFQKLLMFLVAVAIGTQAGAGIVVLIPESMHLMYIEETKDSYLMKCVCVLGGIIFVIVLERFLKLAFHHRKTMKERTVAEITIEAGSTVTMSTIASDNNEKTSHLKEADSQLSLSNGTNGKSVAGNGTVCIQSEKSIVPAEKTEEAAPSKVKQQIATVAWMVMLGDAIHKFVDGLSVGAAFTENITTGLSLAISVLCEEFAHELGDISILLHSGMTMKQAMFWNTLSAAMGIPGLIIGIFVGETTSANQWIFAIAAGIFIYVPLADMIPEMAHTIDKALKEDTGAYFLFFLQITGLCLGFSIIVMVAAYSGEIEL